MEAAQSYKPSEETLARWKAEKERHQAVMARAERHSCGPKHGVFRGVTKAEFNEVARAITYFHGDRAYWSKASGTRKNPTWDVEYVYQCTGGPAERCGKPWQWCGTSILFEDLHRAEERAYEAASQFRIGTRVSFTARGRTIEGVVANTGRRVTVIVPDEGKWYVPANELTAR